VRRLQLFGLGATLLVVLVLVASALAGLFQRTPPERPDAPAEARVDGDRLRVEVLNGSGVSGLARDATRFLRERNFDVVFYGNAPGGAREVSYVIDRVGSLEDAERVAAALGIAEVRSEPDTTLYLEATVVLGTDWAERVGRSRVSGEP
jgi:hypothetical protein